MIGEENRLTIRTHAHFIGIFFGRKSGSGKSVADFNALYGIYAHKRASNVLIELCVNRRAEPWRHPFRDNFDDCAAGRTRLADAIEISCPFLDSGMVRGEERIAVHLLPIPIFAVYFFRPKLNQCAPDCDVRQYLPGHRARCNAHGGLPRRGTAAAAIVPDAILHEVGVIGVAWAELVLDAGIVFRALVLVFYQKGNRRPRCDLNTRIVWKNARYDLDAVFLLALRCEARLPRPALVEIRLNIVFRQGNSGRAAIDHATNGRAMTFAPGRYAE